MHFSLWALTYIGHLLSPVTGSSRLAVLFEQWMACSGHWSESAIYLQMKVEKRLRKCGTRKWLTIHELAMKYASMDVAKKIKAAKESDPEIARTQIRPHPDAPEDEVSCQDQVCSGHVCVGQVSLLRSNNILTNIIMHAWMQDHAYIICYPGYVMLPRMCYVTSL